MAFIIAQTRGNFWFGDWEAVKHSLRTTVSLKKLVLCKPPAELRVLWANAGLGPRPDLSERSAQDTHDFLQPIGELC